MTPKAAPESPKPDGGDKATGSQDVADTIGAATVKKTKGSSKISNKAIGHPGLRVPASQIAPPPGLDSGPQTAKEVEQLRESGPPPSSGQSHRVPAPAPKSAFPGQHGYAQVESQRVSPHRPALQAQVDSRMLSGQNRAAPNVAGSTIGGPSGPSQGPAGAWLLPYGRQPAGNQAPPRQGYPPAKGSVPPHLQQMAQAAAMFPTPDARRQGPSANWAGLDPRLHWQAQAQAQAHAVQAAQAYAQAHAKHAQQYEEVSRRCLPQAAAAALRKLAAAEEMLQLASTSSSAPGQGRTLPMNTHGNAQSWHYSQGDMADERPAIAVAPQAHEEAIARAQANAARLQLLSSAGIGKKLPQREAPAKKEDKDISAITANADIETPAPKAAEGEEAGTSNTSEVANTAEAAQKADKKAEALEEEQKRRFGTIKAYNHMAGFGHIKCLEVWKKYGCDVFMNQAVDGGIIVGGLVSFDLEISTLGKPQARDIVLEAETSSQLGPDGSVVAGSSEPFRGRVKSFNIARGFGFIHCLNLQDTYSGRDIYVSTKEAPNGRLNVGQEIDFRVSLDRQGQPRARDVTLVASRRNFGPTGTEGRRYDSSASDVAIGLRLFG